MPIATSPESEAPPSYDRQEAASRPSLVPKCFGRKELTSKSTLGPWLGLRARLFLSPISIPLLSLVFVASRLIMSSHDVTDSVTSTKARLLSACDAAEGTASLAASLPHFLAATTSAQLAESVTAAVHGSARVFDLSITAIEKILTYIVDTYRSLFLCFMELLVRGSLAVLIEAVQLISQAITAAAQGIRAAIQDSIQGINALLSTAVGGINDLVGVFGKHITPPHIDMPSLTALENITLPHQIEDGLAKLNATLPTLQQLKQTMDALIETPFEQMKREVNQTLGGFELNQTIFPLPDVQNVTFCDRIDTNPLDELGEELKKGARWGLVLFALIALVVILLGAGMEWWCWRRELKAVERTRAVWLSQHHKDDNAIPVDSKGPDHVGDFLKTDSLMSLLTISRHPLLSSFGLGFCQRAGIHTRLAQDRFYWLLAFLTHPASLACLFTGLLGLLSIALQTFLVHHLTSHYTSSVDTSLSHLTSDILNLVNDRSRNASHAFSSSANAVILQVESELNEHVFNWVDATTSTMNNTLNQFMDGITDALTSTFGGTPFNAPLQTFLQCIIGQKVKGIEKALTWIHDNAHVNFTLVPEDVLMLKDGQQEAMLQPVKTALVGSGTGEDGGGFVGNVVGSYLRHLEQEKIMFAMLLGVYGMIVVVGLAAVAYATIVDRRFGSGNNVGEKDTSAELEETLRADLKATPTVTWWNRVPNIHLKPSGMMSFLKRADAGSSSELKDTCAAVPRTSVADSPRRVHTHVTKDSISYPFQIHHSLGVQPPSSRPQQQTPFRQASSTERDTVLSMQQEGIKHQHSPKQVQRSSWLSFLDKSSAYDCARSHLQAGHDEDRGEEIAENRFQRLFKGPPHASSTSSFSRDLQIPATADASSIECMDEKGKEERKYRQTLDLSEVQDWIGSHSPVPRQSHTEEEAKQRSSDAVHLIRSGAVQNSSESQTPGGSYAFATTHPQQRMQRIGSPQSISFYAW